MNAREKLSAFFILPGMALLCAGQIPAAAAGVAMLGAGAAVLNWEEIRANLHKIGSYRPRGAQYIARQPKPDARVTAASNRPVRSRTKSPAERKLRRSNEDITFKF